MLGTAGGRFVPVAAVMVCLSAWGGPRVFNIKDYGDRIQPAVDAAKAAGGGTVYIPAGRYESGPIALTSNLVLNIDAGATLAFPARKLPFTRGRWQGIEAITPVPLIGGNNLQNVTITGRGTITTNQRDWVKVMYEPAAGPNWLHLLEELELKQPVPEADYQKAAPELLPMFVSLMNSRNVLIEGIHIVGSAMWPIQLVYTDNATVRGIMVETFGGHDTGGIYVDSSSNVRISNCYIDTGDDGIVIKSGKDADGRRVNRPVENVVITNCSVHRAHGAVVLGSENAGGIRNLVASNITCDGTQMGVRIKSRRGRGGTIEDIRFDNWTMENVGRGITVSSYYVMAPENKSTAPPEPVSERTPIFRNIAVSHMTIHNARLAFDIEGLPEMPISGLRISDVIVSSKIGMKAFNTDAMELHNVQINAASGPAFLVRDSKHMELDDVTTRQPLADTPVIRLDHCPGTIVRNSRAFSGTGTFVSVAPGEMQEVKLAGNTLEKARTAAEESAKEYPMTAETATEAVWNAKEK